MHRCSEHEVAADAAVRRLCPDVGSGSCRAAREASHEFEADEEATRASSCARTAAALARHRRRRRNGPRARANDGRRASRDVATARASSKPNPRRREHCVCVVTSSRTRRPSKTRAEQMTVLVARQSCAMPWAAAKRYSEEPESGLAEAGLEIGRCGEAAHKFRARRDSSETADSSVMSVVVVKRFAATAFGRLRRR